MTETTAIRAWAAQEASKPLVPHSYDPGALGAEEVEIRVDHCGVCHSDLSLIDNEWGFSAYPIVGGHEVIGTVVALGSQAKGLKLGQKVGVGWMAGSCMTCRSCIGGEPICVVPACQPSWATTAGLPSAFVPTGCGRVPFLKA